MTRRPRASRSADLADLLREHGPGLTTELIERLVAAGTTPAAARQRIVRGLASDYEIKRLAGLRFQHNARFIYLMDQWGDARFWRALERAFRRAGQSYWRAVVGLRARGGWIPRTLFATASGAPAARRGQLSPERILERLRAIQLLDVEIDADGVEHVTFRPFAYHKDTPAEVRARLLAERVALEGVREWVRRLNFGSYDRVRLRGDDPAPQVSGMSWDVSAPSYVRPLVSVGPDEKARSGFIVADILLRDVVQTEAVEAFVSKHDLAAALKNVGPIMPMLVADGFTRDAIALARGRGLIPGTIGVVLGDEIARALRELVVMLTDLGATVAADPTRLERVLDALTKIEGAAGNVRGALFELAAGYLAREVEGGFMTVGLQVRDPLTGRGADVDVIVDRPEDAPVLIIECKAKSPGSLVSRAEAERWRLDRIPLIQNALELDSRYRGRRLDFQLWSNGELHPAAGTWLAGQALPEGPHLVSWKDGPALKEYLRTAKSGVIAKIMDEHYFRHPLAKIVRPGVGLANDRGES